MWSWRIMGHVILKILGGNRDRAKRTQEYGKGKPKGEYHIQISLAVSRWVCIVDLRHKIRPHSPDQYFSFNNDPMKQSFPCILKNAEIHMLYLEKVTWVLAFLSQSTQVSSVIAYRNIVWPPCCRHRILHKLHKCNSQSRSLLAAL